VNKPSKAGASKLAGYTRDDLIRMSNGADAGLPMAGPLSSNCWTMKKRFTVDEFKTFIGELFRPKETLDFQDTDYSREEVAAIAHELGAPTGEIEKVLRAFDGRERRANPESKSLAAPGKKPSSGVAGAPPMSRAVANKDDIDAFFEGRPVAFELDRRPAAPREIWLGERNRGQSERTITVQHRKEAVSVSVVESIVPNNHSSWFPRRKNSLGSRPEAAAAAKSPSPQRVSKSQSSRIKVIPLPRPSRRRPSYE
jgi:hypothetical protein